MPTKSRKKQATLPITVHTMEAELKFHIQEHFTGHDLFDMVCRTIGLREHWYFDLEFHGMNDLRFWLKRNKKVIDQCSTTSSSEEIECWFLVKFYPEDVSEELIQEITQHLFFLQVKQLIVNMQIYCQPEASVLLASYAAQAKHGDYDDATFVPGTLYVADLLPQTVIDQYQMTVEMWEERIKIWYSDHKGLVRDDAEKEYLKIAQDLEQFGFSYFPIKNKKGTEIILGVNSLGLHVFQNNNKLQPLITFPWREIRNIEHTDKKFKVRTFDSSHNDEPTFYSRNLQTNNMLFELCEGNHQLYKQRRLPDSLEVQQMKAQAKEEREKKQLEKARLNREFELRAQLQADKEEMEQRLISVQQENSLMRDALQRSEETAELLGQKAELLEDECQLLRQKAAEAESELGRAQINVKKTEEEKMIVELRAREAEFLATRILEDSEKRAREMEALKMELERAQQAEQLAKTKLAALHTNSMSTYCMSTGSENFTNGTVAAADDELQNADITQLQLAMDNERKQFEEKSQSLQATLASLKSDMDMLKVEEKQSELDRLHEEGAERGENKYRTLQKTSAGSTKSRVAFFEEL